MKYSFIIPVYNAREYLGECVESILGQTYEDFEIILVDDGSTDDSGRRCDDYEAIDPRCRSIHQRNSGTSAARNTGIRNSSGDYLIFMDNDDFWGYDSALEQLDALLEESHADVLAYRTANYWMDTSSLDYDGHNVQRDMVFGQDRDAALANLISSGLFYRAVWSKIVKRDLVIRYDLFFEEGMRNEDTEWTARLMIFAKSYDWFDGEPFYVWRRGFGSSQSQQLPDDMQISDLFYILVLYTSLCDTGLFDTSFVEIMRSYLAYPYIVLLAQCELIRSDHSLGILHDAKDLGYLLNADLDPKVRKIRIIERILGYRLTAKLLATYMRRKYY